MDPYRKRDTAEELIRFPSLPPSHSAAPPEGGEWDPSASEEFKAWLRSPAAVVAFHRDAKGKSPMAPPPGFEYEHYYGAGAAAGSSSYYAEQHESETKKGGKRGGKVAELEQFLARRSSNDRVEDIRHDSRHDPTRGHKGEVYSKVYQGGEGYNRAEGYKGDSYNKGEGYFVDQGESYKGSPYNYEYWGVPQIPPHHVGSPHHSPLHHSPLHHSPPHHSPPHHSPPHYSPPHHSPPHHSPPHHSPPHHSPPHHSPPQHSPYSAQSPHLLVGSPEFRDYDQGSSSVPAPTGRFPERPLSTQSTPRTLPPPPPPPKRYEASPRYSNAPTAAPTASRRDYYYSGYGSPPAYSTADAYPYGVPPGGSPPPPAAAYHGGHYSKGASAVTGAAVYGGAAGVYGGYYNTSGPYKSKEKPSSRNASKEELHTIPRKSSSKRVGPLLISEIREQKIRESLLSYVVYCFGDLSGASSGSSNLFLSNAVEMELVISMLFTEACERTVADKRHANEKGNEEGKEDEVKTLERRKMESYELFADIVDDLKDHPCLCRLSEDNSPASALVGLVKGEKDRKPLPKRSKDAFLRIIMTVCQTGFANTVDKLNHYYKDDYILINSRHAEDVRLRGENEADILPDIEQVQLIRRGSMEVLEHPKDAGDHDDPGDGSSIEQRKMGENLAEIAKRMSFSQLVGDIFLPRQRSSVLLDSREIERDAEGFRHLHNDLSEEQECTVLKRHALRCGVFMAHLFMKKLVSVKAIISLIDQLLNMSVMESSSNPSGAPPGHGTSRKYVEPEISCGSKMMGVSSISHVVEQHRPSKDKFGSSKDYPSKDYPGSSKSASKEVKSTSKELCDTSTKEHHHVANQLLTYDSSATYDSSSPVGKKEHGFDTATSAVLSASNPTRDHTFYSASSKDRGILKHSGNSSPVDKLPEHLEVFDKLSSGLNPAVSKQNPALKAGTVKVTSPMASKTSTSTRLPCFAIPMEFQVTLACHILVVIGTRLESLSGATAQVRAHLSKLLWLRNLQFKKKNIFSRQTEQLIHNILVLQKMNWKCPDKSRWNHERVYSEDPIASSASEKDLRELRTDQQGNPIIHNYV